MCDLNMRSIIDTCLDFDKPLSMAETANKLLDYIFSRPPTNANMHLLMGLFEKVANLKSPLTDYSKFFFDNDSQFIKTTTFGGEFGLPPWAYQALPFNS